MYFVADNSIIHTTMTINMDINDFVGLFKYKLIIPSMYLISWILMFIGPLYFQVIYQRICIGILLYSCYKMTMMFIISTSGSIKAWRIINRAKSAAQLESNAYESVEHFSDDIIHAFIVPSYKEDIELLADTLKVLSTHRRAQQTYMIFLAMEMHQVDSDKKALELIARFKTKFRAMEYTQHVVKEHQQKGKASNVSWCAEHMQPFFAKHMIDPSSVMLTIIDADSWAPNVYFDEVEDHMRLHPATRHLHIYQPPQIFTRNNLKVPMMSRVEDIMHSFMHFSNTQSMMNVTFPLSNYTFSYNLAKRIGFWDTCADAIGQDFHTAQKAFWKTQGEAIAVPIYVPFNEVNLQTGGGYWADMSAKFWQAERHARGVADVAYNTKMFVNQPFRFKTFWVFYQTLEAFSLPATIPWAIISLTIQSLNILAGATPSPQLVSQVYISWVFNYMNILNLIAYLFYEVVKRRATKELYGLQNESIFRIVEFPVLVVFYLFLINVPVFVISAFGSLFQGRQYVVADKIIEKEKLMIPQ